MEHPVGSVVVGQGHDRVVVQGHHGTWGLRKKEGGGERGVRIKYLECHKHDKRKGRYLQGGSR